MRSRRSLRIPLAVATLAAASLAGFATLDAASRRDPLQAEIARWSSRVQRDTSRHEIWVQVRQASAPHLIAAEDALQHGWRWLALQRLGAAHMNLAAASYLSERIAAGAADSAGFEAEWRRSSALVRRDRATPASFAGVRPALVRGLAEAALPQARVYHDASLEYGRNTMPEYGVFYLGAARAQREHAAFLRSLGEPASGSALAPRSIEVELAALERELLAAYRPPASIDRHPEFIVAAGTLKEARELEAAGLRHGALVRYLQAALRSSPLRDSTGFLVGTALANRLREHEARLTAGTDHTIGRWLLETAAADLAAAGDSGRAMVAAAIAKDAMPRYFEALGPAPPAAPAVPPEVTVTLVRWPYT